MSDKDSDGTRRGKQLRTILKRALGRALMDCKITFVQWHVSSAKQSIEGVESLRVFATLLKIIVLIQLTSLFDFRL